MFVKGACGKIELRAQLDSRISIGIGCLPDRIYSWRKEFAVDAPCKAWVSDITYIHTTHGFRYLTSVIDLYDRKVIGWSMSGRLTAA